MKIKLNLIPPYKKEEIRQANRFLAVLKWQLGTLILLAIFLLILLSINYILRMNLFVAGSDRNSDSAISSQLKEIEKYDTDLKNMNVGIAEIAKVQKDQLYWSEFFLKFDAKVPESVEIGGIATKNYSIFISGKADARDDLIFFKENLEKEECFESVNLPLSNLVAKADIDFQMDFSIKKECLLK